MKTRDRAAGTLELAAAAACEDDCRPAEPVLEAQATMPTTPWCQLSRNRHSVQARPSNSSRSSVASASSCIVASTSRRSRLSASSSLAERECGRGVLGEKTANACRHVREAPRRRLRRGPATNPRSEAVASRGSRLATRKSASTCSKTSAAARALFNRNARLAELHDVGHGAERHEVEQRREVRPVPGKSPGVAQSRARRCKHVEHHCPRRRGASTGTRTPADSPRSPARVRIDQADDGR